MKTIEDMIFSIERQRAARAVDGKLPSILEVDAGLAEDGDDVVVLVELDDDRGTIASGFSLSSIVKPDEKVMCDVLRVLLDGVREARKAFAAEVETAAIAHLDEGAP